MNRSTHPIVENRRKVREAPGPHFTKVAKAWESIIGSPVSPEQVCLCLAMLKLVREAGMPGVDPDNLADAHGYMTLVPEVLEYMTYPANPTPGPEPTFAEMAMRLDTKVTNTDRIAGSDVYDRTRPVRADEE